jgi:copper chaperone CopZ
MTETILDVCNVKCGGCVAKCEAALKTVPGFVDASFDIPAKTAIIRGNPDMQIVMAVLQRAGYPASLKNA